MNTLIVVDMQNDFVTGSLGTAQAQVIIKGVRAKIEDYLARGDRIIFTRDTHGEDYLNTAEGIKLPVEHCIKGTWGWQVLDEIDIPSAQHIDKPNFGYPNWNKDFSFSNVELVGVCTDICVVSNALILKAQFPNANITVDASCCAGVSKQTHLAALQTMKMCQINIIGE